MADKSSESKDLPKDDPQSGKSPEGGSEATEGLSTKEKEEQGLPAEQKKGFQRLVSKKDKEISDLQKQINEYNKKLNEYQQEQRQRKLSDMDETTKWKTIAQENAEKAAKAELKSFVSTELARRNLADHPISDLISETPWAIPTVKRRLSPEPTWDETIEAVKENLPSYLESLEQPEKKVETKAEEEETTEPEGMEPERSAAKSTKKAWTRAEVKTYLDSSENRKDFEKRRAVIQEALTEGRIR